MNKRVKAEKSKNIDVLIGIRDDLYTEPVVVVQAVRTMQKIIDKEHPETEKNLKALMKIRDDENIKASIRVMAMQSLNTMFDILDDEVSDDRPTEEDIMNKIRGKKK